MTADGAEVKIRARRCSCKAFGLLSVSFAVCLCLFFEHQRHDALAWVHNRHGEVRGPRFLKGAAGAATSPAAAAASSAAASSLPMEERVELERLRSELQAVRAQADAAHAELHELRKQSGAGDRLETAAPASAVPSTAETGVRESPNSRDVQVAGAPDAEADSVEKAIVRKAPITLPPAAAAQTTSTSTTVEDDKEDKLPIPESLWRQPPEDLEAQTLESDVGEDVASQAKVPAATEPSVAHAEIPAPPSQVAVQEPEIIVKAGGSEIRVQVGQAKDDAVPSLPKEDPPPKSLPSDHEGTGSADEVDDDDHDVSPLSSAQAIEPAPAPPMQPEISVKTGGQEIVVTINSDAGSQGSQPSPPLHQPGTTQPIQLPQVHSQAEATAPEATEQHSQLPARLSNTSEVLAGAGQTAGTKSAEVAAPELAVKSGAATNHSKADQGGTQITVKSGSQSITITVVTNGDTAPATGTQAEVTEASAGPTSTPTVSAEDGQAASSPTMQEDNGQPSWLNAPLSGLSEEESKEKDDAQTEEESPDESRDSGDSAFAPQDVATQAESAAELAPPETTAEPAASEAPPPSDEYANLALRAR